MVPGGARSPAPVPLLGARVPDLPARLRSWSLARQRLTQPAASPIEALQAVAGVYSSHPSAPLSLWLRTRRLSAGDFRAMEAARATVRLPAMRNTVFLLPAATAHISFRATAMPPEVLERRLVSRGLDLQDYRALTPRILSAASEPRTPAELARLARYSGAQLGTVLRMLSYEGLLLRVGAHSLRADSLRYVATRVWLGRSLGGEDGDQTRAEALAQLAATYLSAFGPARASDFAWWAGVTVAKARQAIARHATIDLADGLLLLKGDEAAFERTKAPTRSVLVLPKWDAYTMGYAPDGRARLVDRDLQPRVYPGMGDGLPVILVDGQVVGLWTAAKGADPVIQPFERIGPRTRAAVATQLAKAVRFLDNA